LTYRENGLSGCQWCQACQACQASLDVTSISGGCGVGWGRGMMVGLPIRATYSLVRKIRREKERISQVAILRPGEVNGD
jgi:hypothetical protein